MDDENVGADGESGLGATLGEEELWRQRGGGRKAGPSLGVGRRRKSSSSKAHALGRLAGEEGGKILGNLGDLCKDEVTFWGGGYGRGWYLLIYLCAF